MTAIAEPIATQSSGSMPTGEGDGPQRFVFADVDWAFYQDVRRRLVGRRAFIAYFKGKLEVVTLSYLHERITGIVTLLIRELAVAARIPICGAGAATLDREDLDEGTQPDASVYTTHAARMTGKTQIDLTIDPPPDLAVEVEVTHRLGQRRQIYQELGVPEVWVCGAAGLTVLLRQSDGTYRPTERSSTFPLLTSAEMHVFVADRTSQDDTAIQIAFRDYLGQVMAAATARSASHATPTA